MSKVFISYRRSDSQDMSLLIYERLSQAFGKQAVFYDLYDIPVGASYRDFIKEKLRKVKMVLTVIGPRWIDALDNDGSQRIFHADDLVRLEIEIALELGITIIPVLLSDTSLPEKNQLPSSLEALHARNIARIRSGADFDPDINRMIHDIVSYGRIPLAKGNPLTGTLFSFLNLMGCFTVSLSIFYVLDVGSEALTGSIFFGFMGFLLLAPYLAHGLRRRQKFGRQARGEAKTIRALYRYFGIAFGVILIAIGFLDIYDQGKSFYSTYIGLGIIIAFCSLCLSGSWNQGKDWLSLRGMLLFHVIFYAFTGADEAARGRWEKMIDFTIIAGILFLLYLALTVDASWESLRKSKSLADTVP